MLSPRLSPRLPPRLDRPAIATGLATLLAMAGCRATPTPGEVVHGDHLVNLYDAFGPADPGLTQDWGFSTLIRYGDHTILFDAGTHADVLARNAAALGIDLAEVDLAVVSHAHFDHVNGFDYLLSVHPDVKIYFPADLYWGMNVPFDVAGPEPGAGGLLDPEQRYFGGERESLTFNQSGRFWGADVEFVGSHREILPGVTLIATRSPYVGYFTRYPTIGGIEQGAGSVGDVTTIDLPELSLHLASPEGDVLVVGCSHSQVETIVEATLEHHDRPVGLVYGGYHLLPYTTEEVEGIALRMRDELGVGRVAPAHCTGHVGFRVFREVFGDAYTAAGLGTTTPFP